jgi:hypothetical protein
MPAKRAGRPRARPHSVVEKHLGPAHVYPRARLGQGKESAASLSLIAGVIALWLRGGRVGRFYSSRLYSAKFCNSPLSWVAIIVCSQRRSKDDLWFFEPRGDPMDPAAGPGLAAQDQLGLVQAAGLRGPRRPLGAGLQRVQDGPVGLRIRDGSRHDRSGSRTRRNAEICFCTRLAACRGAEPHTASVISSRLSAGSHAAATPPTPPDAGAAQA